MGHDSIKGTLLSTPYSANLHSAIGAACRGMGLANFLEVWKGNRRREEGERGRKCTFFFFFFLFFFFPIGSNCFCI